MKSEHKKFILDSCHSSILNHYEFREGDIFYNDESAYDEIWSEARKKITYTIQVVKVTPRKNSSGKNTILKNKTSRIDVIVYDKDDNKIFKSVSGAYLFLALTTGDMSFLDKGDELPVDGEYSLKLAYRSSGWKLNDGNIKRKVKVKDCKYLLDYVSLYHSSF